MALSCYIRPCCLVWTAEWLEMNESLRSPPFFLKDQKYTLTFTRCLCDGITMYNLRIEDERTDQSNYRASVSVEPGDVTELMASGVFGHSHPSPQTIWEFRASKIKKQFPQYFSNRKSFNFLLSFFSTTPGDDDKAMEPTLQCAQSETVKTAEIPCLESLSRDLSKFLDEDSHQDLELKCGDQIIKVHRNFLSIRSRVFAAMLQSDMIKGRTGLIEVWDIKPELFQCFIRYIYTGKLPQLTFETARSLYEAGDKYKVEGLTRRCSHFMRQNLAPENACDLLVLADAHSDLNFKEDIFSFILDNKIPVQDDIYEPFSNIHPELSNEVLKRFCKMQNQPRKKFKIM